MEEEFRINSSDLVEHANLSRKRAEAIFRKDFLVRKGAKEEDELIKAMQAQIEEIDGKFEPLDKKLKGVDILTVVPNRAEIIALTNELAQYSKEELDEALKAKQGVIYDLLKKRAFYTKVNYDNREQIARITILLNMLPRKEAESLRTIMESNANETVDVSVLDDGQKKELVNCMGRAGIFAFISANMLNLDKKKVAGPEILSWPGEIEKKICEARGLKKTVWVRKDFDLQWEENEKKLAQVGTRIQVMITKSQAEPMNEEELKEFDTIQRQYINLKAKRDELVSSKEELAVFLPPRAEGKKSEIGDGEPPWVKQASLQGA